MEKNAAGNPGYKPNDTLPGPALSSDTRKTEPTDYERYRRLSFYFEAVLQQTLERAGDWPPRGDGKAFLVQLAAGCFASGIPEEEAVRWSLLHLGLQVSEREVRLLFRNQYRIKRGFGQKPDLPPAQLAAWQLEEFMRRRYELRFNTWSEHLEYRERQAFDFVFRPLTSRVIHHMAWEAACEGFQLAPTLLKNYLASDRIPSFSPFKAWFDRLPLWDGSDHIRRLAATVPCVHKDWPDFFFRWFLGRVARWAPWGPYKQQTVDLAPWFFGPEGCGKRAFCMRLLPLEYRTLYAAYPDTSFVLQSPAQQRHFALIRLEADAPQTAAFIRSSVRAHGKITLPGKTSWVFTGTSPSFSWALGESTGLFPVAVGGLIRLADPPDYGQLYAEAYELLRSGERYGFTPEEVAAWSVPVAGRKRGRKRGG